MRMSPEKDWGANAGLGIARDFVGGELLYKHAHATRRETRPAAHAVAMSDFFQH